MNTLYTVSRIPWRVQLEHSPSVLNDLVNICGLPAYDRHEHINLYTITGWLALRRIRGNAVAVLDAIPAIPSLLRILNPSVLLSTYGDRHIHVALGRWPIFDRVLRWVERLEVLDAEASDIVKSSGSMALEYIESQTKRKPKCVHVPDVFEPYTTKVPVFLYQGNLRWDKGFDEIIEYAEAEGAELLIIGDGPYRKTLEKISRTKPFIRVLGRVDNPEPYWRIATEIVTARTDARCNQFALPGLVARARANNKPCVFFAHGEKVKCNKQFT